MLRLPIGFKGIHIMERKFLLPDSLHIEEDIQQPALGLRYSWT